MVMAIMRVHPIVVPVAGVATLVYHAVPIHGVVAATGVHVSGGLVVGMVVMRVHPIGVPVAGVANLVRHVVPIFAIAGLERVNQRSSGLQKSMLIRTHRIVIRERIPVTGRQHPEQSRR